jgi:hypothetical protein
VNYDMNEILGAFVRTTTRVERSLAEESGLPPKFTSTMKLHHQALMTGLAMELTKGDLSDEDDECGSDTGSFT